MHIQGYKFYLIYYRRSIRYNILINPTGKVGKFRAVDWCVELNNLYTKVSISVCFERLGLEC
jgi:hypothetical protein